MLHQLIVAAEHANKRLIVFYKRKLQIQKCLVEDNMCASLALDRKLIEIDKAIRADKMRLANYNESIRWMSNHSS